MLLAVSLLFVLSAKAEVRETWLAPVEIFGTQAEMIEYPTQPQRITKKKLESLQTTDVTKVLKQVSGAYVREEDGLGLRPNIGLRGTNPDRSKKISLYQDGILIGPAPYSAPAAYFTPSLVLSESMEVYKGFAALPFGPNSVGGAVQYLTRPLPEKSAAHAKVSVGSFNTQLYKLRFEKAGEQNSFSMQVARLQSDGFKKIDRGGSTGYTQNHFQLNWGRKLQHPQQLSHSIRAYFSYEDEKSNETYLGLTQNDFSKSFKRRYNASQLDQMQWSHQALQLHHDYQLSPESALQSKIYFHQFQRTWFRLDGFNDNAVNLRDILNQPGSFTNYYNILKGDQDSTSLGVNGQLRLVNNDRNYYSQGVQSAYSQVINYPTVSHEIEISARIHKDQIKRDHTENLHEMVSNQLLPVAAATQSTLNQDQATALTTTFLDHIKYQDWTLTPAFRFENVEFKYEDHLGSTQKNRNDDIMVSGLSLMRKINSNSSIRTSLNQAATLSGLTSDGREKNEEATLYEIEWNYVSSQIEMQATYFYNDYQNLTGTCTVSSGCTNSQLDVQFNGGKAIIDGTEIKLGKNYQVAAVDFPVTLNLTYLNSRFDSEFTSTSPEWGIGTIKKGDPLPYVPSLISSLNFGTRKGRYYQEISIFHQSSVYDQSAAADRVKIPAYGIIDFSAQYKYSEKGQILFKWDNVLAREYTVAARPFGLRPGKPQSFQVGLQHDF